MYYHNRYTDGVLRNASGPNICVCLGGTGAVGLFGAVHSLRTRKRQVPKRKAVDVGGGWAALYLH